MRTHVLVRNLIWALCTIFGCVGVAQAQITVTEAQIGCIDKPNSKNVGNLTQIVANACNGKFSCSFKAPTPQQYTAENVHPYTRPLCTQAMEITYQCGTGTSQSVEVPGDAWQHNPADLECPAPISAGGGGAQGQPSGFPISKSQQDHIQGQGALTGDGNMHTDLTISASGQLSATTHTWSTNSAFGFHGSVAAVLLDQNQQLLWVSQTQTYGVKCTGAPCTFDSGPSDRTDNWNDTVPAQLLAQARYLAIKQRWNPKPVSANDIANWLGAGNDVANLLGPILQGIQTSIYTPPPPLGTVAANIQTVTPTDETCPLVLNPQSPRGLLTADYRWAPAEFLDNAKGPEDSDGRVNGVLRQHAQMRDAHRILSDAVLAYLHAPITMRVGRVSIPIPESPNLAPALAQLAVTGRNAFASFAQWHPQDNDLAQYVQQANPNLKVDPKVLQSASGKILDTAYTTLWAIRANDANWRQFRQGMGWIAVSSEDDLPHRPVNTFTAPYPQYDVTFQIPGVSGPFTVGTRYMVASAGNSLSLPPGAHGAVPVNPRSIPVDGTPVVPAQDKIIIYIHGGGSRLEEAVPLAQHLMEEAANKGIPLTVMSFDMPNSGLSSPFDHTLVANAGPGGGLGSYKPPTGDPNKPIPNPPLTYGYPIMDTEEQFVLNFIDAIDHQIGNVKGRIVAVMGGSLGGNMSFRLARRAHEVPYLRNIVSWSVTCMQGAENPNIVGHIGGLIGKYTEAEQPGTRHDFFDNLYNKPLVPVALPPQPELWYRDGWNCKNSYIQQSKFDRYEYYTPEFRRWTYRLNYEMTIYSFSEGDLYAPNRAQGPARYLMVNSRMLLASGDQDEHDPLYTLYGSTVEVAKRMVSTPGMALFMRGTGHSIHDERPKYFAQQIVSFLDLTPSTGTTTASTPPAIINQPQNSIVSIGESAGFAITASGAAPLHYQWRRNGLPISGATSPNYVTPPVTPSDLGAQFAVVVSNSVGSVTSSAATILGQLSATVSSTVASGSVTDAITVTSGGAPVAGVTVTSGTTGNSPFVTNASGVVVITHGECFTGPVAKVGDTTAPKRTPVPCKFTEMASKAGYQTISFTLP